MIAILEGRMAALEGALVNHVNENEVLKRRLCGPRTERSGTSELQHSLGDLLKQQDELQKKRDEAVRKSGGAAAAATATGGDDNAATPKEKPARPTLKGRGNLAESSLPRVRVDLRDGDIGRAAVA